MRSDLQASSGFWRLFVPKQSGLASKRFWFTDLDSVFPGEPARILEKVFFTPKDFEEGALYSFRD